MVKISGQLPFEPGIESLIDNPHPPTPIFSRIWYEPISAPCLTEMAATTGKGLSTVWLPHLLLTNPALPPEHWGACSHCSCKKVLHFSGPIANTAPKYIGILSICPFQQCKTNIMHKLGKKIEKTNDHCQTHSSGCCGPHP